MNHRQEVGIEIRERELRERGRERGRGGLRRRGSDVQILTETSVDCCILGYFHDYITLQFNWVTVMVQLGYGSSTTSVILHMNRN